MEALPHPYARLASGWWLAITAGESNSLDSNERFPSPHHFLLSQAYPGATLTPPCGTTAVGEWMFDGLSSCLHLVRIAVHALSSVRCDDEPDSSSQQIFGSRTDSGSPDLLVLHGLYSNAVEPRGVRPPGGCSGSPGTGCPGQISSSARRGAGSCRRMSPSGAPRPRHPS